VLANLAATLDWVREQNEENLATARAYFAAEGAFPERAAINHLGGRFLTDFYAMVARWAEWATGVVADWPDDPGRAVADPAAQEEAVRVAESIADIGRAKV
jgi:hypothetical protein